MSSKRLLITISTVILCLAVVVSTFLFFFQKAQKIEPLIIWTNRTEFVSYAEYFNAIQDDVKVIVVYKESPAESFPPAKDEQSPDIVIGPWLKNERIRKNFISLDYLFTDFQISTSSFYPQLFALGNIADKQYLLPVSFNLPVIIFSKENASMIPDNYTLSLDQIRSTASAFNKQNKSGTYTVMGFAPRWEEKFLYLATKLKGANFHEASTEAFSWSSEAFQNTIAYLKDWTLTENSSTSAEEDFKFKYLYTPEYKQITSDKCLFAYITSDQLFSTPTEQLQSIDFRWTHENNDIPIEDQIISMGIYKKSRNTDAADAFIIWFMKEETQRQLLERTRDMNIQTSTFGISGGFSSIRSVNEHVFPTFYPTLLENLPVANQLVTPNILPARWETIKERVIIPYIIDAIDTKHESADKPIEERIAEWNKQYF